MTLHEAIEKLLKEKGKSMSAREIADELNKNKWYEKGDKSEIKSSQISARVDDHLDIFEINRTVSPIQISLYESKPQKIVNSKPKSTEIRKSFSTKKNVSSETDSILESKENLHELETKIVKSSLEIKENTNNKAVNVIFIVAAVFITFFIIRLIYLHHNNSNNSEKNKNEIPYLIIDTTNNGFVKNYYQESKKIESEGKKISGLKAGLWVFYSKDGNILEKSFFKNDLRNGLSEIYSKAGFLIEKCSYKNDKKNGIAKTFYDDGRINEIYFYNNNEKNGNYIQYDYIPKIDNHFICVKGTYKNDLKNGEWRYYEYYFDIETKKLGNKLILVEIINYKNNVLHGKNINFNGEYGFKLIETNYDNGLESGMRKSYCPNGKDRGKLYLLEEYYQGNKIKNFPKKCACESNYYE